MKTLLTTMTVLLLSSAIANGQEGKSLDTQVIEDKEKDNVVIKINGRTVGIFDKDGLSVFGDIKYNGALIPSSENKTENSIGVNDRKFMQLKSEE